MKDNISVITIVFKSCLCLILISHVELYNLTCPSEAHWKIRAKVNCNSTFKYFCLYNNVKEIYVEGCNGPDWDRKGSKRIFSGSFTRGNCTQNRYQPFNFQTNGGMSDCIFEKSICNEEGQIVYQADSTKDDRTCRCDYTKNYAFVKTPRNLCYCNPTEEDCSCYIRSCRLNYTLSTDYDCIQSGYQENPTCIYNTKHYETIEEKLPVKMENNSLWFHTSIKLERQSLTAATVFLCLCLILAIGGVLFAVYKSISKKLHRLKIYFLRRKTGTLPTDEVNFLRIVHLLFRVACPVLKMKLNDEIKPNELRKTLDENRLKMETQYRKNETIINDYQWGLLYNSVKGDQVKSDDFDIRLIMYLLRTLVNIKIGNVYPDPSDKSYNAALSRIKYIRNELTRRFAADLSEDKFNQYWDDIIQAVLTLVSELDIENDQETTRLIDNLKSMRIHEGCHLHHRDYKITCFTTEENNFLVVFYILAQIVYPLIKNEYYTKFPEWRINEISMDASRNQHTEYCKDDFNSKKQDTSLIKEQTHISLPKKEEPKNLDLRWMVCILNSKAKTEGNKDYTDELDVICDIQREIVQSSYGVLNDERLHDILQCLQKAVVHFGGKWNEEKLLHLQHTQIF